MLKNEIEIKFIRMYIHTCMYVQLVKALYCEWTIIQDSLLLLFSGYIESQEKNETDFMKFYCNRILLDFV